MLRSMTGFGRATKTNSSKSISVEIKSVNHRFKDVRFKGPAILNPIELEIKKILGQLFKRGSFDIFCNVKSIMTNKDESISKMDWDKVDKFLNQFKKVGEKHSLDLKIDPVSFLNSNFYCEVSEKDGVELRQLALEVFQMSLEFLKLSREEEGQKMLVYMSDHKKIFQSLLREIHKKADQHRKCITNNLEQKFEKLSFKGEIDQSRFLQELVYYLEKMDIEEELNRIDIHLQKMDQIFSRTQFSSVGRELEFLLQELGREINTIGSKSSNVEISENIVQMKVELEKMREQALNVE